MKFDIQKAGIYKRISAFLFDIIMLGIVAVGVGFLLSYLLRYDSHLNEMNEIRSSYEQEYDISFETTYEEYVAMSENEKKKFDDANIALQKDREAQKSYSVLINLTLMLISLSTLIAYLIWEFIIPLCLKNGQTLGKKIFGIAVIHTSGIKITPMLLFIRTVLGKYTLETMVPMLIMMMIFMNSIGVIGAIILGLLAITQLVLIIATPTNSLIHDILAKTVVIDLASQMIFEDGAALLEYQKARAAEEAENKDY